MPLPPCPAPTSCLLGKRGVGTLASACPLPWPGDVRANVDYFPPGVTGEDAAGEAAGT